MISTTLKSCDRSFQLASQGGEWRKTSLTRRRKMMPSDRARQQAQATRRQRCVLSPLLSKCTASSKGNEKTLSMFAGSVTYLSSKAGDVFSESRHFRQAVHCEAPHQETAGGEYFLAAPQCRDGIVSVALTCRFRMGVYCGILGVVQTDVPSCRSMRQVDDSANQ